jgi:hypothetical protein
MLKVRLGSKPLYPNGYTLRDRVEKSILMTELDKNIKISRAIAFCFNALQINLATTKIGLLFIAKFS